MKLLIRPVWHREKPSAALQQLCAVVLAAALSITVGSCSWGGTGSSPMSAEPAVVENPVEPSAAAGPTPALESEGVSPNELGSIPILEFHQIVDGEEDQWSITPDHFRRTLQQLYDAGFRPISLNDLLDKRIDLPAGTSPVVLTFDDSSPGQLRFIDRDGQVMVDPACAVGILEDFHSSHPDFEVRATFNVLPEAAEPNKLFGQPQYEQMKLRYLAEHGLEIGNHTYWHQRLDEIDDQEVQRQLALAVKEIDQAVPGYRVRVLALPLGLWPANRTLAISGSYQGVGYQNDAILLVGSDPALSPYSVEFDPYALPRVQVFGRNLDRWLAYYQQHPDERYVSDGDPGAISFPKALASSLDGAAVGARTVRAY